MALAGAAATLALLGRAIPAGACWGRRRSLARLVAAKTEPISIPLDSQDLLGGINPTTDAWAVRFCPSWSAAKV